MGNKQKSGGAAPYGYRRTENGFEPDPHEAPIRKLIFELFLTHKRKLTVATTLNKKGYRTRTGAEFSDSSINRFLRDPIVKGHHKDNYKKTSDTQRYRSLKPKPEWRYPPLDPLIDEATWNQVDNLINTNRKTPPPKKPSGIFGGHLTCTCGAKMHLPHGRKSYFCSSCDNRIDTEIVESIFAQQLEVFTIDPVEYENKIMAQSNNSHTKQKTAIIRTEKSSVESEVDKLYDLYISGALSKERFRAKNDPLETRLKSLTQELSDLTQTKDTSPTNLFLHWQTLPDNKKHYLVELITNSITVGHTNIKISFALSPS